MLNRIFKSLLLIPAIVMFVALGKADSNIPVNDEHQVADNGWGPDSAQAVRCHSLYRGDLQMGNLESAYPNWKCNYELAPGSTLRVYIDGVTILRHLINEASDESVKEAYIDTLMMLYDDRIKYFGNEGYVLGRKALDLLRFRSSELQTVYEWLDKSIEIQGNETEYTIPNAYIQILSRLYNNEIVERSDYIEKYMRVNDIIDHNLNEGGQYQSHWIRVQESVQATVSRHLDCDDLTVIYQKRFEENPEDTALLKAITDALEGNNCTSEKLYIKAAEKLIKIEPSAKLANNLANEYMERGETQKARSLLKKALDLEEDPNVKAELHMRLAENYHSTNEYRSAREEALNAARLRNDWGIPYLFIGNLYLHGAEQCDNGFTLNVIYIAAVEQYEKAKEVDSDVESNANRLINEYEKHFPSVEDAFYRDLDEGDTYQIGCWINKSVKLRLKK